jgi:hypothetical protein
MAMVEGHGSVFDNLGLQSDMADAEIVIEHFACFAQNARPG